MTEIYRMWACMIRKGHSLRWRTWREGTCLCAHDPVLIYAQQLEFHWLFKSPDMQTGPVRCLHIQKYTQTFRFSEIVEEKLFPLEIFLCPDKFLIYFLLFQCATIFIALTLLQCAWKHLHIVTQEYPKSWMYIFANEVTGINCFTDAC